MNIPPPVIKTLAIKDLKPWPKNPRKGHAVDQITRSITEFGYQAPIIVQKKTYRVIAGHGRIEALKKMGIEKVPVIVADLTNQQADLYTIADNKLTEIAGWDTESLAKLVDELKAQAADLSLTGFDADELKRLAQYMPPNLKDETDETPELPVNPISRAGDIWELGAHRLMCGDSTKPPDVARLMANECATLMNTDPPYGVDLSATKKGMPGFTSIEENGPIENDDLTDGAQLQAFLESVIRSALPHLSDNPAFYLWHPMLTQGTFFAAAAAAAAAADILIHRQIIWVKPQMVLTRSGMYHWKHELCFYGWIRGKPCAWYGDKSQVSVWELGESLRSRSHPTQKPVELFSIPMRNNTSSGDVCYEPFSGSGSQIIAAEKEGRRCYAMEIAPAYVDVAVKRWQNFTGKKARNLTRQRVIIP